MVLRYLSVLPLIVTVVMPPVLASPATPPQAVYSAKSATCVEVHGHTPTDRDRALAFCARGVSSGTVTGVIAMDTLLWLKVTPAIAGAMRQDRVASEQLVKNYLRGWRFHTGRNAVSVYLELGDVELARGETTLLGSDAVTLR